MQPEIFYYLDFFQVGNLKKVGFHPWKFRKKSGDHPEKNLGTPGPHLMQIHLVRYSTTARSGKNPQIFT